MSYFYANLSDYEFESLSRDILEKITGVEIRRFALGRDGGKDLTDVKTQNEIVGQAKRYIHSDYRQLERQAKIESKRLDNIKPKQYFFFTTRALTPKRIEKIYNIFSKYMPSMENVFDSLRIDEFLSKPENNDLLRKHPKLIMSDMTAIEISFQKIIKNTINRNISIDVEDLKLKIKNVQKYFVDTNIYIQMHSSLKKEKVILVMGNPGTGKTVSSYMTILTLMKEKYLPICSSSNNLDDIKKAISGDEIKEVILMDDFLGRIDSTISASEYSKQLETLINLIKTKKNKLLILNSRNYIWDYCKNNSAIFEEKIGSINLTIINTNHLSKMEKGRILYNHIYHSNIPKEYKEQIYKNHFFLNIINHSKYNPRVIEHILKSKHYQNIPPENYQNYILNTIDDPNLLWESEYRERLSQSDRLLLQTLYSMSEDKVPVDKLRLAFEELILDNTSIDKTINPFSKSLDSLSNSFLVKISSQALSKTFVSFANPSIMDFLKGIISSMEKQKIIDAAIYIEQYIRLVDDFTNSDVMYKLIITNKISLIKSMYWEYPELLALSYIINNIDLFDTKISDFILKVLMKERFQISAFHKYDYQGYIVSSIENKFLFKFGLHDKILKEENLNIILSNLDYNHILSIYNKFKKNEVFSSVNTERLIKEKYLKDKFEAALDCIEDQLSYNAVDYFDRTYYDEAAILEKMIEESVDILEKESKTSPILDGKYKFIKEEVENFICNNSDDILEKIDFVRENYLEEEPDREYDIDYRNGHQLSEEVGDDVIIEMFLP